MTPVVLYYSHFMSIEFGSSIHNIIIGNDNFHYFSLYCHFSKAIGKPMKWYIDYYTLNGRLRK